ncbi:MAG TPA: ABC transporter ATP-binding protein [Anaerolineales bacterium]|nr:ABC transporter ATP-binding protein [Anaerolineales bacterium]
MALPSEQVHDPETLVVKDITKRFAGLAALQNVSLALKRGEILGLIGPNGSGKTTLINVVTGLLPANGGQILVGDIDITNKHSYDIAHNGVSRTFQTIRLFRELTVQENVEVAALSVGFPRREARVLAAQALEEMGISRWSAYLAGELPYGLERRVEVSRALAMKPRFLLLDEPAAGLNEDESAELVTILKPIPSEKNLGILIVDHDMRLIMGLCHRLHVLNYGKTIGEGTPEEVRRIPAVVQAYLGKAEEGAERAVGQ